MHFVATAVVLLTGSSIATSLSTPDRIKLSEPELISREDANLIQRNGEVLYADLAKRRGGGGGGGGKGGGSAPGTPASGSSGSTGSSSSGSSGGKGSSGSSGGAGASSGRGVSSSTTAAPTYAGGRYAGGSSTAYSAGGRSPAGVAPYLLAGAALGFFPGIWLAGAYAYPYSHTYVYHNSSAPPNQQNQTLPVECFCAQYSACGCDDTGNTTYLDGVLSGPNANASIAQIATVNGTKEVVINGTLPNGTDGSDTSGSGSTTGAASKAMAEVSGYWVMVAMAGLTVWGL